MPQEMAFPGEKGEAIKDPLPYDLTNLHELYELMKLHFVDLGSCNGHHRIGGL